MLVFDEDVITLLHNLSMTEKFYLWHVLRCGYVEYVLCRTCLYFKQTLLLVWWTLLHYPQITRVDIVQFKRGRNVPACTVELEWTGSGEPKPLSHQVKISGAKETGTLLSTCITILKLLVSSTFVHTCTSMCTYLNFISLLFLLSDTSPVILVIRYFSCQILQYTR